MDMLISQLANSLNGANTIEQLIRPLLDMLGNVTGMESTYLTAIELDNDIQRVTHARNTGTLQIPEGIEVNWGDTLCKRSIDMKLTSTDDVKHLWGDSVAARQLGIQSYMSAPIRTSAGQLVGTLCAASSDKLAISGKANNLIVLLAKIVANFIEREMLVDELKSVNQTLQKIALTDVLTNLPNRRALLETLERMLAQSIRMQTCILIGVIDLDGFKQINDEFGHRVGDLFLQETAKRLSTCLRATDMLGRLGGDEFLFIGYGPGWLDVDGGRTAANLMRQRLTKATEGEYLLIDISLPYSGASVGVIAIGPDIISGEEAIQLADTAMYHHKKVRKARAINLKAQ